MRNTGIALIGLLMISSFAAKSQSLPVGSVGLEDVYRRKQLAGEFDSNVSFTIRPLIPLYAFKQRDGFYPDSLA